jgi:hypothetical protein
MQDEEQKPTPEPIEEPKQENKEHAKPGPVTYVVSKPFQKFNEGDVFDPKGFSIKSIERLLAYGHIALKAEG